MAFKKNVAIALFANALPFLVGLIVLPYTLKFYGVEIVGFLSLFMIFVGYAGVLDMGLSRALTIVATKYLLLDDLKRLNKIFWTSLFFSFTLSVFVLSLLLLFIFNFRSGVINVVYQEVIKNNIFYIILTIVVLIGSTLIAGILASFKKFDQINLLKSFFNTCVISAPVIAYKLNLGISGIIILIFFFRLLNFIVYLTYLLYVECKFRTIKIELNTLKEVLKEGSWISFSNIVSPIIVYLDRFLLAAFTNLASVVYYSSSLDTFSKIIILPSTITGILFPSFIEKNIVDNDKGLALFHKTLIQIIMVIAPIIFVLIICVKQLLTFWISEKFADSSYEISQILLLGIFWNGLSQLPMTYLQAIGKSKTTGLIHLIEFVIFLPITYLFINLYGIVGASMSWTLRVFVDFLLLMFFSGKALCYKFEFSKYTFIMLIFCILNVFALFYSINFKSVIYIVILFITVYFTIFLKSRILYEKS
ncbi:MAG: polysaccharide biosynthesis C-terminal domain-containing protein [Bacteroidota bacterium]